ncbi:MAG: metal ABC transporter substrate-binding protein [Arachnia sp.]
MRFRRLIPLSAALLALSSCSGAEPTDPRDTAAAEGAASVTVAFYPLEYVTSAIGGQWVSVTDLTTPGTDAHDLELTPQQLAAVTESDLVVYLSDFQPSVDDAITASSPQRVLDAAEAASLESLAEEADHDEETDAEHDDHADETDAEHDDHADETDAEHDDHADETDAEHDDHADDDGHDHGDLDPHFWLDPTRLASVAAAVAEELSAIDPEHSDEFEANLAELNAQLDEVDDHFTEGLAECKIDTIITSHTAFGYLAERYGLHQVGIAGLSTQEEPSPARIAEVQELATEYGVTTIFFETLASDAVAESIANDLGLATAVLDPVASINDQSAGADYPSVMEANLAAIRSANECS